MISPAIYGGFPMIFFPPAPKFREIFGLPDQGLAVFFFSEFREVIPSIENNTSWYLILLMEEIHTTPLYNLDNQGPELFIHGIFMVILLGTKMSCWNLVNRS